MRNIYEINSGEFLPVYSQTRTSLHAVRHGIVREPAIDEHSPSSSILEFTLDQTFCMSETRYFHRRSAGSPLILAHPPIFEPVIPLARSNILSG